MRPAACGGDTTEIEQEIAALQAEDVELHEEDVALLTAARNGGGGDDLLLRWNAAKAKSGGARAKWMAITDSYGELGALQVLQARMASIMNFFTPNALSGGIGFVPARNSLGSMTTTGDASTDGPANYATELSGSETVGPVSLVGEAFEVYFKPNTGTVTVQVDSGSAVAFDTATNNGVYTTPTVRFSVHTVTITRTGGATNTIFWGIFPAAGNRASGVGYYACAHTGYNIAEMSAATQSVVFAQQINPDLIVFEFGINDYNDYDADTYVANFETMVEAYRTALSAHPPSMAFWFPPETTSHTDWADWQAAMKAKCAELGVFLTDQFEALGNIGNNGTNPDPEGLSSDGVHLNTDGNNTSVLPFANGIAPHIWVHRDLARTADVTATNLASSDLTETDKYWCPDHSARASAALTLNRLYYFPLRALFPTNLFYSRVHIDRIGFESQTGGGAGSVVRMGIYDTATLAPRPGALIYETPAMASTGTGAIEDTVSPDLMLIPGLYWIAWVTQVAAVTSRNITVVRQMPMANAAAIIGGSVVGTHLFQNTVTGALPSTASSTPGQGNGNIPLMFIRS